MSVKTEWIKFRYMGGRPTVWHLPAEGQLLPACQTNGPNGEVVSVQLAEILPQGKVCSNCAKLFMQRLKRNLEESIRRELIRKRVDVKGIHICLEDCPDHPIQKEDTIICPPVPIAKQP